MNWKNVLYLLRVERKSGRLVRGVKATRYREHGFLAYWPYWVAAIIGVIGGLIANVAVDAFYNSGVALDGLALPPLPEAANGFFVTIPTLILILSIVFTMLQQIQLAGLKKTSQVMYWLPVTWQEHTLASVLANLLGFPIAIVVGLSAGLIVFSAFNPVLIISVLVTILAMAAAAFMGSATTEILRILLTRFTGAVYKSSGRAAIYIRLISFLLLIMLFYLAYFYIFTGSGGLVVIESIASFQSNLWFVPFVWPGIVMFYLLIGSEYLLGIAFTVATVLFIVGLYYLAVLLNQRYGLYEPPAIRVQTSGVYAPKAGILGKLGFTSAEAALIQKDTRAFTRRRELLGIFIVPIVFTIVSIFNSVNNQGGPPVLEVMFAAMIFVLPAPFMAMLLGNMLIGEEGQAAWRIYASPISPKNLVKAKYSFLVLFAIVVQIITSIVGIVYFRPSIDIAVIGVVEGLLLLFALGSMGLAFGFKGADFTATKRARMIRQEWSLISMVACALAGLAILAPLAPYVLVKFFVLSFPTFFPVLDNMLFVILLVVSGVIAAAISVVFYRINLKSAAELIRKAET